MDRAPRRIRFVECTLEPAGERVRGRVVLGDGEAGDVTGSAERPNGEHADIWCVAEATVDALRRILGIGADALVLKEAVMFDISGTPAVAVFLRAMADGRKRRLFGLTQAEADRGRAAALAVLNATNRFVSQG